MVFELIHDKRKANTTWLVWNVVRSLDVTWVHACTYLLTTRLIMPCTVFFSGITFLELFIDMTHYYSTFQDMRYFGIWFFFDIWLSKEVVIKNEKRNFNAISNQHRKSSVSFWRARSCDVRYQTTLVMISCNKEAGEQAKFSIESNKMAFDRTAGTTHWFRRQHLDWDPRTKTVSTTSPQSTPHAGGQTLGLVMLRNLSSDSSPSSSMQTTCSSEPPSADKKISPLAKVTSSQRRSVRAAVNIERHRRASSWSMQRTSAISAADAKANSPLYLQPVIYYPYYQR